MDTNEALMLAKLLDQAGLVERMSSSDIADVIKRHLANAQNCGEFFKLFKQHLEHAGYVSVLDQQWEPRAPGERFPFPDTPGTYRYVPPPPGSFEVQRKNEDLLAAEALLDLAVKLGCDWVEEGKKLLDQKVGRQFEIG